MIVRLESSHGSENSVFSETKVCLQQEEGSQAATEDGSHGSNGKEIKAKGRMDARKTQGGSVNCCLLIVTNVAPHSMGGHTAAVVQRAE